MVEYRIEIERGQREGKLRYAGHKQVEATCWWDPERPIPARTYTGCSARHMATKKNSRGGPREGILLPDAQTGRSGIFIHMGNNAGWSDGCIVLPEPKMLEIWNDIEPKNAANVTVSVTDVAVAASSYELGVNLGWVTVPRDATSHDDAWEHRGSGLAYVTVQLTQELTAMRVTQHPSPERILTGDWFAIGDFIAARTEYRDRFALRSMQVNYGGRLLESRGGFQHAGLCALPSGSKLNVGPAAPLFGWQGQGLQAEWLRAANEARNLSPRLLHSFPSSAWSDRWGRA